MTPDALNQLLAGQAAEIVHSNFSGVTEQWWWERRIGGGVAICQTLDPLKMSKELAESANVPPETAKDAIVHELGLEDDSPLTLTFEIPGDATMETAASILQTRSATPRGIAENVYREVSASLEASG